MQVQFQISIIDQSGLEQLLDFYFRNRGQAGLYGNVRNTIRDVFSRELDKILPLFSYRPEPIHCDVYLEQEKTTESHETLAAFDSGRSALGKYVFHVYYGTIRQVAEYLLGDRDDAIQQAFASTVLHELLHAADLDILRETNTILEMNYRLYGAAEFTSLRDAHAPDYDWNVQWTLLRFFQVFRNEGIAMLGQHLLDGHTQSPRSVNSNELLSRFRLVIQDVLKFCSGMRFYNNLEAHSVNTILQERALEAYQYGALVLLELLQSLHPGESAICRELKESLSTGKPSLTDSGSTIDILRRAMQIDLSEYIQAVFTSETLNRDEPLPRQQFLSCCAILQNEDQGEQVSAFARDIGICGFNRDSGLFINLMRGILGSRMTGEEIESGFARLLETEGQEDILNSIKNMAAKLVSFDRENDKEVATWALTYLFDDQDLIYDRLSFLGWQDDWMVLDAACRILGVNHGRDEQLKN